VKHINVEVEEEIYEAAKRAAKSEGVFLKKWIERLIIAGAGNGQPRPNTPAKDGKSFRELTSEPFKEAP
jgi:hypothetical protein